MKRKWKAVTGTLILSLVMIAPTAMRENRGTGTYIDRTMDRVVIKGERLADLDGLPINKLRLVALKQGEAVPVPFQIDELDPLGYYVMDRPDGKHDRDADNGLLDKNDELVFMAMDACGRAPEGHFGEKRYQEIKLTDPVDGGSAYLYLVYYEDIPPPLSEKSYMRYEEGEEFDQVITPYYILRFPKNDVFIRDFIMLPEAGGSGEDIMDRIKMRSGIDVLSALTITRTEEDFDTVILGCVVGPVRVIRQSGTRLSLLLSLKAPSVVVDGSFYPCSFEFPSMLSMPFRLDMIASDAYIRQGWDLNRTALGMKFFSNLEPGGVVLDGTMSEAEKKLAKNRNTLHWAIGTGGPGTFMFSGVWDESAPFRAVLYYEDDLSRLEPPESEPGVMGFAYRLEDLIKMGGEEYGFNIVNYVVPDFDGDIERAIRVYDHPLEVTVNR